MLLLVGRPRGLCLFDAVVEHVEVDARSGRQSFQMPASTIQNQRSRRISRGRFFLRL